MHAESTRAPGARRSGRWRTGEKSRARILESARACFAERGYDRATIRRIAAQAQVDPAMVYYFFESKARLFNEALEIPSAPVEHLGLALEPGADGAGERLVQHFLDVWDSTESIDPLLLMVRSAPADHRSSAMFTEYVQREIIGKIAAVANGEDADLRAELISAHLMGLAMARYVTRLEPLASCSAAVLASWVGSSLQRYLSGSPPTT